MHKINTLLRDRESIRLKIQDLESKKNSGQTLNGNEIAILKDMHDRLRIIEDKLTNKR